MQHVAHRTSDEIAQLKNRIEALEDGMRKYEHTLIKCQDRRDTLEKALRVIAGAKHGDSDFPMDPWEVCEIMGNIARAALKEEGEE